MTARLRLLLLPLLCGLAACDSKPAAPAAAAARPVLSVVVEPHASIAAGFAGTVEPQVTTDLAFRVPGRLVSRPADIGDVVSKGQVLATVDTTALEFAMRSAQADLTSAQSQLALASAEAARQQSLLQSSNASQAAVDAAVQQHQAAQSGVTRAQSALSKAEQQLGYAEITADYAGVVTATSSEVGQVVSPGEVILTLAQPTGRDAVVDVPDYLSTEMHLGTAFDVALQLDPSIKVSGAVREVAPQADQATRTRRIKIGLINPPGTFWLGTTVTATLAEAGAATLSLPPSALLTADGGTKVWVVDEAKNTVASLPVTVGAAARDGSVPVLTGLSAGQRVVTAGVHSLEDGEAVQLAEASGS